MQNFQDTFKTGKQPFINAFSICMTVPLAWGILEFRRNSPTSADTEDFSQNPNQTSTYR